MWLKRRLDITACWSTLLIASALVSGTYAKKEAPDVKANKVAHRPENVQYFEDSDVIVFQDWNDNIVYRSADAGETWHKIDAVPANAAWNMVLHPVDKKRAYIFTQDTTHWKTHDRGETWHKFSTGASPSSWRTPIAFHASDPDKIIFNGQDCMGYFCDELAKYTTDGFETTKLLREDTTGCYWAKSTATWDSKDEGRDKNRILCITQGKYSSWSDDYRLMISDTYFQDEFEPELEPGRSVVGVTNMAAVKKFIVAAASSKQTDEMAMYVTTDTVKWHRAIFPHDHKLEEDAYTILESTDYSIQVDVLTTSRVSNPMGVFFSSNSNGTFFSRNIEHTNRIPQGYVDFEKMSGVEGIVFVNVVENWQDVQKSSSKKKKVVSQISFDDGRTWQNMKFGNEKLHIHSVTEMRNIGRMFSSPAPGLMMAVGNTGEHLGAWKDGDTYVSDDAGLTWRKALNGPHKYEFGDQGSIIVAIQDGWTDKLKYSLDHGLTWESVDLPEAPFGADILTTTQDSTSLKFLLIGAKKNDDDKVEHYTMSVDFDGMHQDTCEDSDLEKWYARNDEKGEASCLMGHKQFYNRRKKDAKCFMRQEFKDPVPQKEQCECTDQDFECDFNFVRNEDGKCERKGDLIIPDDQCKAFDDDTTFTGTSGYRQIPGDDCKRTKDTHQDDPKEWKCSEAVGPPKSGHPANTQVSFPGKAFLYRVYLERTDSGAGDDETIVAQTDKGNVYLSKDHGKTWTEILKDVKIEYIIPHTYFNNVIYFIGANRKVYYSVDRGNDIQEFEDKPPTYPDPTHHWPIMSFHPKHKDWIIWVGVKDRECVGRQPKDRDCHAEASFSDDRGDHWKTLRRFVRKCEFVPPVPGRRLDDKLIYCNVRKKESNSDDDNPWQLVSSSNFFDDQTVHFDDIVDFATTSEFIVVATKDADTNMKAEASVDGTTFAEALFPRSLKVPHQSGYTTLDSSTHAVFLLVNVEPRADLKHGTLIKSNSNGTSYVLSMSAVNQDSEGYVDFEKAKSIEGVALANIVANANTLDKDNVKKIKTKITHNDGADWALVPPPKVDMDKKSYGCSSLTEKCSLHIHGYTERDYKSHTYSSPSAVGIMLGIGSVGEFLGDEKDADTFISTDAGITWNWARKGAYMWEFGDQGSIIVLVKAKQKTNEVYYTLDEGKEWHQYKFADDEMLIYEITTTPSDNSKNFVLWTKNSDGLLAVNLDFSGLLERECKLDQNEGNQDDYFLWSPKHPKQDDDCLFGHVSEFYRKRPEAQCFNGKILIPRLHNIARNCSCTRADYECDYNYFRESEGTCMLAEGTTPSSHIDECKADPNKIEYFDPSGYRRIPLTTCQGGQEFDKTGDSHPCPGKDEEYNRKHGISGVGLFFAIILPVVAAVGAGWWVWRNWAGKFGQIRLGECKSTATAHNFASSLTSCSGSIRRRRRLRQIPRYRYICRRGSHYHFAISRVECVAVSQQAVGTYQDGEVHNEK
jgi:hypothetical protein